jgi:hypothetical protein
MVTNVVINPANPEFPSLVTCNKNGRLELIDELWPLKYVALGTKIPYHTLCYRIRNKTLNAIKIGNAYYIRGSVYHALFMEQAAKVRQASMAEAA